MNAIWTYVVALLFGIIIFIVPAIVAYIIARYLVIFGGWHSAIDEKKIRCIKNREVLL